MTTEYSSDPQPSPMPRDYNPDTDDAYVVRQGDSHLNEGDTADERRNRHPLD